MKRVLLFLTTNIAIVVVLSITLRLLGVENLFHNKGLNFNALLIFAFVFGMSGAFISLAISKWSAKAMTGMQVLVKPSTPAEIWLVDTVKRQATTVGIGVPEVAIYQSVNMNAFATGMNRNHALVAVSSGLLEKMTKDEVEAVLGHEVSHIANGDMVTLALIQGVTNVFVIFSSRVMGYIVDRALSRNSEVYRGPGLVYHITSILVEVIVSILASAVVMWFSRWREFHADSDSARLVGSQKMIAALQRLQMTHTGQLPDQFAAFGISSSKSSNLIGYLFASHPPLEERIEALRHQ